MEMSKELLTAFLTRTIELLMQEETKPSAYIVFSGSWSVKLPEMIRQIKHKNEFDLIAVLSKEQMEDDLYLNLALSECKQILTREEALRQECYKQTTIYPIFHRDLLAKAALGISDTYETLWIQKAFEQGGKIKMIANGFDHFTGFEPEAYQKKILSYVKMLMEYGIEIEIENKEVKE
ncbi:hypothetical protein lbkm_1152 [Lachnospiraceae bacterium KM106-2]|nr:hypothetical protein lbkm_1152 [Lachnospiraceae bacterium KM106-2]